MGTTVVPSAIMETLKVLKVSVIAVASLNLVSYVYTNILCSFARGNEMNVEL